MKQHEALMREQSKQEGKLAQACEFTRDVTLIKREEAPLNFLARTTHFSLQVLRQLEELFNRISASQTDDLLIDLHELAESMGLRPNSLLAHTLFRLFDITQSNSLNFRTWVLTLSALSTKATLDEKIRFSFGLYDLNGDGKIDLQELSGLLQEVLADTMTELSPEEVREICERTLKDADKDGNGTVDLEEYTALCKSSQGFLEAFSIDVEKLCQTITRRTISGRSSVSAGSEGEGKEHRGTIDRPLHVMSSKLVEQRQMQFREKKMMRNVPNQLPGAIAAAQADGRNFLSPNSVPVPSPGPKEGVSHPLSSPQKSPSPLTPPPPSSPMAFDPAVKQETSYAEGVFTNSSQNLLKSLEALKDHLNAHALENAVRLMVGPSGQFTPTLTPQPSHAGHPPQVTELSLGVTVSFSNTSASPRNLNSSRTTLAASGEGDHTQPAACCAGRSHVSGTVYPENPGSETETGYPPSPPPKVATPVVVATPSLPDTTPFLQIGVSSRAGAISPESPSPSAESPLPLGLTHTASINDVIGAGLVEEEVLYAEPIEDLDDLDVDHEDELLAAKQRAELEEALSRGGAGAGTAVAELFRQTRNWDIPPTPQTPARQ